MRLSCIAIIVTLCSLLPSTLLSQQAENDLSFLYLFHNLPQNTLGSFTHAYGTTHLASMASTYGLVQGGFDWQYYEFMDRNEWIPRAGFVSVISGGLVPLTVPATLYLYGDSQNDRELMVTGLALGQAAMLGIGISSFYKAFTGRKGPEILDAEIDQDYSDDFKFGFLERGVFDGWPSGHTTTAVAMATTLSELYPENTAVQIGSFTYAAVIGLGISTNIHWFSDFVAGSLIGYSIGKSVGRGFQSLLNNDFAQSHQPPALQFSATPQSVRVIYRF